MPEPTYRLTGLPGSEPLAQTASSPTDTPSEQDEAPDMTTQEVSATTDAELTEIVEQEREQLKEQDLLNKAAPEE